jgi:hypothetical protein
MSPPPSRHALARTYLEAVMRMLLKAVVDTEAGNEGLRSVPEALDRLHEFLKPEAFYGVTEDGQRAFIAVFDLAGGPFPNTGGLGAHLPAHEGQNHDYSMHDLRRREEGCWRGGRPDAGYAGRARAVTSTCREQEGRKGPPFASS